MTKFCKNRMIPEVLMDVLLSRVTAHSQNAGVISDKAITTDGGY